MEWKTSLSESVSKSCVAIDAKTTSANGDGDVGGMLSFQTVAYRRPRANSRYLICASGFNRLVFAVCMFFRAGINEDNDDVMACVYEHAVFCSWRVCNLYKRA